MPISEIEVEEAYLEILGRPPESQEVLADQAASVATKAELVATLFLSIEFRAKNNLDTRKVVFIHLAKCGGTSLDFALRSTLENLTVCPEKNNEMWRYPVWQLASCNYFSGHFDFFSSHLIPGNNKCSFTILREPVSRLSSYYYFLRSHSEHHHQLMKNTGRDNTLPLLACSKGFLDFLNDPLIFERWDVYNPYVQTFLDRRSLDGEICWIPFQERTQMIKDTPDECLEIAKQNLFSLDWFTFLDELDDTVGELFTLLGYPQPVSLERRQALDELRESDPNFQVITKEEMTPMLEDVIHKNTSLDLELYRAAKEWRRGNCR